MTEASNSIDPRLMNALTAHQEGRLGVAEAGYLELLAGNPDDPDALHFLGLLRMQQQRPADAIGLVQRSLERAPQNAHAWNNLGNLYVTQDNDAAAIDAYLKALSIDFEISPAWKNLGDCIERSGSPQKAVALFSRIIESKPGLLPAYEAPARVLRALGMNDLALGIYRRWAELEPDRPTARHLLAANSGEGVPSRAADEYMVELFNGFAADFDEKLAKLDYCAPQLLAERLRAQLGANSPALDILDAGCGTGLCGPLLRPLAARLVGVDLSPRMLEKAQERGTYDELVTEELCAFMRGRPQQFDVVVSADTLCYFGELEEALAAARSCLRAGGYLAFTVEAMPEDGSPLGHAIQPHGRYTHSEAYLRRCLAGAGFATPMIDRVVLRKEIRRDVGGFAVIAALDRRP
jgi:predicted TPR repeat methyltransferase